MSFSPEFLALREFHPIVIREIIRAILWAIVKPIQLRRENHATIKAISLLDFYPFCAEWNENTNVLFIFNGGDNDDFYAEKAS